MKRIQFFRREPYIEHCVQLRAHFFDSDRFECFPLLLDFLFFCDHLQPMCRLVLLFRRERPTGLGFLVSDLFAGEGLLFRIPRFYIYINNNIFIRRNKRYLQTENSALGAVCPMWPRKDWTAVQSTWLTKKRSDVRRTVFSWLRD